MIRPQLLLSSIAAAGALLTLPGCNRGAPSQTEPPARAAAESLPATTAAQAFVGSAVCAECHAAQNESYRDTAHSQSLSLVDPEAEPPDATFLHERSGRSYTVYREGGQLRQREFLSAAPAGRIANPSAALPETALGNQAASTNPPNLYDDSYIGSDYAVTYLVGSGRHSRTYLSEVDGFLVEAPITWYQSRRAWALSPGYDTPEPPGFERPADMGCLACHVGRAEAVDGSYHRIAFHELAIGCERCHGPGAEHVARRRAAGDGSVSDEAIVHPGKLTRELGEALCAQCHLRGDATVFLPGLGPLDLRPGEPLHSVRIDYRPERKDSRMTVVGHVEQMWLSRCYTQSANLTCTTCHDMHASESITDLAAFYRSKCLECHTAGDCGLPAESERRTSAADDCLTCHMPQTDTDIPHIAFTDHRIGIHEGTAGPPAALELPVQLVPMFDASTVPEPIRDRCVALGYLEFADRQTSPAVRRACQEHALAIADRLARQGPLDGDLLAGVARVYWEHRPDLAVETARQALSGVDLSAGARCNAHFVIGDTLYQMRRPAEALPALEALIRLRRNSEDWVLLGLSRGASGQPRAAPAIEQALQINPFRSDLRSLSLPPSP